MTAYFPSAQNPGGKSSDGDLEGGFNEDFERRFLSFSTGARILTAIFLLVAASGLLGRGPLSQRTAVSAQGALQAEYEPVARNLAPTTITLRFPPSLRGPVTIRLSSSFATPMGLQSILPRPAASAVDGAGLLITIAAQPGPGERRLRINLQPAAFGFVRMSATILANGAERPANVSWRQLILP